ncbi:hypothetical protein PQX77_014253 [Marasmius sp. AFHP31]|nr:hypothetical protein PQX77_014253 [Marasmius sp. AFHP31]
MRGSPGVGGKPSFLPRPYGRLSRRFGALTRLTTLFMERSQKCALDLKITFPEGSFEPEASLVINVLSEASTRWQCFTLSIPDTISTRSDLLFPNAQGKILPILKHLRIENRPTNAMRQTLEPITRLFATSPSLCSSEVVRRGRLIANLGIPFGQITRMELDTAYTPTVLRLLGKFPRLQELRLIYIVQMEDPDVQHIRSSTMGSLSLSVKTQTAMDSPFQHLTIPSLEVLTLSSSPSFHATVLEFRRGWTCSAIGDFLTRSGCHITSLCLHTLPITDTEAFSLLKFMPMLNSLRVEEGLTLPSASINDTNIIVTEIFLRQLVVNPETYQSGRSGTAFLSFLTDIVFKVRARGPAGEDLFAVVAFRWVPEAERARELGVKCLRSADITVVGCDDRANSSP